MIDIRHLSKSYPSRHGPVTVLDDINITIGRGEKVGFLGRNGAGKSTLIRLIGGVEPPTRGEVVRNMTISWPLAFGGAFQGSLTGLDNLRFICRIYGVDDKEKIEFVEDFCELGRSFKEPVKTYSSGMAARLAFAISMAVEFDCFLIDEVIAVGDHRFSERCQRELFEKRGDRALIIVSHNADMIREHCSRACVLDQGRMTSFDDLDEAYRFYESR
jgi:capsular polysaccharide transport system ATP-binding protein